MTSRLFRGSLVFKYNEQGRLTQFIVDAELNAKQQATLAGALPWTVEQAKQFMADYNTAIFLVQEREITFEMFWNRYNDKSRSSLKKTRAKWDKMTKTEQAKAFLYIPTYLRNKGTAEKKYATTYLNDELWNN